MATIKSYTDIEQSRKLAEILPIESADMRYSPLGDNMHPWVWTDTFIEKDAIPCWSLTSLLDVIPKKINFGYENYSTFVLKPLENGKYLADYYDVSFVKDNPVDACYEVIIKLNELNLL